MSPASRFWAMALGAGAVSGTIYMAVSKAPIGAGMLLYFGQLPLFVAGLSFGATASAIAGTAAAGAVLYTRGFEIALVFAVMFMIPVPVLVRQALLSRRDQEGKTEWYPPGLLTGWLIGIGAALLALGGAWMASKGGIEAGARQMASQMVEALAQLTGQPAPNEEARAQGAANLGSVLLGSMAAVLSAITAINGILAQGLLARLGWNRRPSPDMAALDLPMVMPALFLFCLVAGSMLPGDIGYLLRSMMPVLLLGGVLSGLAVVHAAVRRLDGKFWMLAMVYTICAVMVLPLFLLAAIGLAEPFARLRQRMGTA